MDLEDIIKRVKNHVLVSAINEFQLLKQRDSLKRTVYTSFDGDYMPFLPNMLVYTMSNGYLPINPEAALGYYVSTTTHHGNKILVMQDCLCEELLCDEMWIFNPISGHIPEGVFAEIIVWQDKKGSYIRNIPFFNEFKVELNLHQADAHLENYIMTPLEIGSYINSRNINDTREIRNKLFSDNSLLPVPTYVVANFYNYKHIDWARAYCYQNALCPVSPQNIMPYTMYSGGNSNFEIQYMLDRLTLLDKCKEMIWFTNTRNIDFELNNLDSFSCTELFYWYTNRGLESIKVVDWAEAGVPKYIKNSNWALTTSESSEVESPSKKECKFDSKAIQEKIFKYEDEIKDDFNIFKGGLLGAEECHLITSNSNAFVFGLIADSSVKAEIAWSLPYRLSQRLHHLDLDKIAAMDIKILTDVIKEKPALHRYPSNIAKYLIAAAKLLVGQYQSDASNIWSNGATAADIISRFEEFKGISHKKAALGSLLLVRDLGVNIKDKENINIAYDIHIRRICLRAGFCRQDTIEDVTMAGKLIFPEFPGRLTSSFWAIGRDICRPSNPLCSKCPLDEVCEHNLLLGGDIHA